MESFKVGQASRLPIQLRHFLPVSRSETTMVAVGLSPRTESKHTIRRRVATSELQTGTGTFNRRSAARDNVVSSPHGLNSTATFMASLRAATQAGSLRHLIPNVL